MYLTVGKRRIYANDHGTAHVDGRPAIIFVHGAGLDQSVWTLQARYYASHGHNVLAVNLPGHGVAPSQDQPAGEPAYSDGPLLTSIEDMADWVAELVAAAGAGEAKLVGHSMGALVALETAARHPDRVSKLALLGVAPKIPVHPALLGAAKKGEVLAHEMITVWGHGPVGHFGGNRAPGLWLMGNAMRVLGRSAPEVLHNDLFACNVYEHGLAAAQSLRCPTLIVTGRQDRMTPARQGAKVADAVPDSRLVEFPDSGHMLMGEKPDETLDALIAFFK